MPRRNKNLAGLKKLCFQDPIEFGFFAELAAFSDPEVRAAVDALLKAGEKSAQWLNAMFLFFDTAVAEGFPLGPTLGQTCPFDMLADNFRGMINCIMDIKERPDKLSRALEVMTELCLKNALGGLKALGHRYLFIPLHMGVDEFMSPDDYAEFYWPGLKALMMAGIENGLTPYVFCEGNYNTRLEQLCDVPKGKVIYMFEKVDMKRVKETVGKVACICGNLPTATLMFSTPEKVADETKKLLDICAPGGGFIMDASIVIDRCPKENLHAMFDTTLKYGVY
jgi:uroporphyrinogen-III decarboxylase